MRSQTHSRDWKNVDADSHRLLVQKEKAEREISVEIRSLCARLPQYRTV